MPRSPKLFKNFSTSLTIALSLVPAIALIANRVKTAARLRTQVKGFHRVRSIFVPVVSSAIDQAMNLADSMESRSKNKNTSDSIDIEGLSFAYSNGDLVLDEIAFDAAPGTLTLIFGATGCGKSTLLKAIQARTSVSALVGQFPRESFVAETVYDELAFAPRQQNKNPDEVANAVNELISKFGLKGSDSLLELSAGWQQRVAIAAALAGSAGVLLLDEPFSALDQAGTKLLLQTLGVLKADGITIVIAEHRTKELLPLANRSFALENGKLKATNPTNEVLKKPKPNLGTIKVLLGENGSGKTTFLNQLAKTKGVLVPQPASDLLFLDTVAAELRQSDLDAKAQHEKTAKIFEGFVKNLDLARNPRDLSEGQKLGLAISIQLAKQTDFLMLDEPTLGFDLASRQNLANLLAKIAGSGVEILVATHDQEFAQAIASETIQISQVEAVA